MKLFIKAPSWLVFLALVVAPVVVTYSVQIFFLEKGLDVLDTNHPNAEDFGNFFFLIIDYLRVITFILLIASSLWAIWTAEIVFQLGKKLPAHLKVNRGFAIFNAIFFPLYFFSMYQVSIWVFNDLLSAITHGGGIREYNNHLPLSIYLLYFLSIFVIYAYFASIQLAYSAAKVLVQTETGEKPGLMKFVGAFLCFAFFPIGIWIIQPRVQAAYNQEAPPQEDPFLNDGPTQGYYS